MLSHMNEVDICVTSAVSFVWDAKPVFPIAEHSKYSLIKISLCIALCKVISSMSSSYGLLILSTLNIVLLA